MDVKRKTGRPKKEINKEQFEKICALQATEQEICSFFNVTDKTLTSWCKRTYGQSFSEVYAIKRNMGKLSLRRMQFKLAEKSPAMAIFLGKNMLGQKDKPSGEDGIDKLVEVLGEIRNNL